MSIANQPPSVDDNDIVKSFKFPFQPGPTGFPEMSNPEKAIFYQISNLLMTAKTERVMQPSYGVNIHSYVFDNLTPITMARISGAVTREIETWVPGVMVRKVIPQVMQNADSTKTTVLFFIEYSVTNQQYTAKVPITVGITS